MHDIDNVQFESNDEFEQWENSSSGAEGLEASPFAYEEFEFETAETRPAVPAETGTLFCETGEMELAAELFEVTSEAELEEFLGKLINRASRAAGSVIPSSAKQAIGGVLKGAARQVLPAIISAARGNFTRHPAAGAGNLAAIAAGRLFGLELEGLSGEDQEFEVARSFVRFAGDTVKNLTRSPDSRNPQSAARLAAVAAAQVHAPGLVRGRSGTESSSAGSLPSTGHSGRWMRRGNKIILYGV